MSNKPSSLTAFLNWEYSPYLCILLFAFLLYGNTLRHEYALDDDIVIVKNAYTQEGLAGMGKIFTSDAFEAYFQGKKDLVAGGRYRPLSVATFAAEVEVAGGLNPTLSHLSNVLLYAVLGILLFLVLKDLFPKNPDKQWWASMPFLITLLFLAHPIHTEAVANIKGRDEILAMLLALLSWRSAIKGHDTGNYISMSISGIAFFLALLAKESALPFLLVIPLSLWFFRKANRNRTLVLTASLFLMLGAYLGLRYTMVGLSLGEPSTEILNNPFIGVSFGDRLATISETLGLYLWKLIFPFPLTHDYYYNQIPVITWADWKAWLPALLYVGLLGYAVWQARKKSFVAFGILFYLATLSIVSNIVFSVGTTMGERFVFIPSLGILIAACMGLYQLQRKRQSNQQVLTYGLYAVVILFGMLTVFRNPAWKNNFTLFTTDVATSSNSAKARTSAGGALVEAADSLPAGPQKTQYYTEAVGHLQEAVLIYPEHSQAFLLLGNAHYGLGRYNESLQAFDNAIRLRPQFADAYRNAGVVAGQAKQHERAAGYLREYERFNPGQSEIWFSRGVNYMNVGIGDSALFAFQRTLTLNPQKWEAAGNSALVAGRDMQRFDLAVQYGEQALSLGGNAEWVYENLGIAYAMSGNLPSSLSTFQKGLTQFPNSAKLYLNAGLTYQNLGDAVNAQAMFQKAQSLNPNLGPPPTAN